MTYENALRRLETDIGSIVGVDGAIDCIRRSLYRPMSPDQLPDFVLSLDVVEQGFRAIYDPAAIVVEEALSTDFAEHKMRVRVALRGLWAIWDKRGLLNPLRHPLFSWQLASHKLLRYLSPVPLLAAAGLNWALLSHGPAYVVMAVCQTVFFALALCSILKLQPVSESGACALQLLLSLAELVVCRGSVTIHQGAKDSHLATADRMMSRGAPVRLRIVLDRSIDPNAGTDAFRGRPSGFPVASTFFAEYRFGPPWP